MAGWMKKKRMGGNVQKLWEDNQAYGKGFHDKLFNEEVEEKEKDEKEEVQECGEVDRIAQLVSPDVGGSMSDDDEDEEGETEVTIKVEKEEGEEEDEEELDEGFVGDLLGILGVGPDEITVDLKDPKVKKELKDFLAKASASRVKDAAKELNGEGGPFGSMSKQEETDAEDDEELDEGVKDIAKETLNKIPAMAGLENLESKNATLFNKMVALMTTVTEENEDGEEMEEATADLPLIDKVLSALGETPIQGLVDLLTIAGTVMKGGDEKNQVKTLLDKLKAEAQARGNPLAKEEKEEDLEEGCDKKEIEEEDDEEDEEMDEAMGTVLGGAMARIRNALAATSSPVAKKKVKGEYRKAVGKTGIGSPATKKLSLAGEEDEAETQEELFKKDQEKKAKEKK